MHQTIVNLVFENGKSYFESLETGIKTFVNISDENDFVHHMTSSIEYSEYFTIIENNDYWHKIIAFSDAVFIKENQAMKCAKALSKAIAKFRAWDWAYSCNDEEPDIPWEEAREQLGCKYDGDYYFDIDFRASNAKYYWKLEIRSSHPQSSIAYSWTQIFNLSDLIGHLLFEFDNSDLKNIKYRSYRIVQVPFSPKLESYKTSEFAHIFKKHMYTSSLIYHCAKSILNSAKDISALDEDSIEKFGKYKECF